VAPPAALEAGSKKDQERDAEWKWKAEAIKVASIPFIPFYPLGPRNCPASLSVLDAFAIIFPHSLLDHIIEDTNQYATNKLNTQLGVTKPELCTYFAILLAMSLTITPALKDHWSWDPLLGSPWIYTKMGRNRWLAIHKALHFDIKKVEEIVRTASRDHWSPSQKVCIDEGISPWLGRKKGLRVFVLGKPHPNGIKIFILADENNYAFDFWIYRGSQPPVEELVKEFVCKLPGILVHPSL